jgi:hypothetical protein
VCVRLACALVFAQSGEAVKVVVRSRHFSSKEIAGGKCDNPAVNRFDCTHASTAGRSLTARMHSSRSLYFFGKE